MTLPGAPVIEGLAEALSFQDQYELFRRFARRFALGDSLLDVWRYSLHITEGQPLPGNYLTGNPYPSEVPLSEHVYSWDLDILTRELILHARTGYFASLQNWNDLAAVINQLRKLDEAAMSPADGSTPDINLELHRIAHRQFPWQGKRGVDPIIRTFKIYGAPEVDAIVVRELGMSTRQFLLLGMTLGGQFFRSPENSVTVNYAPLGIPLAAQVAFFDRITTTAPKLKAELAGRPLASRDWLYRWNPLEARPLVIVNPWRPGVAQCPIPRHLLRRMSSGLYYDLVGKKGFENPFGHSFQSYVGDIIAVTCTPPMFIALKEVSYKIGLNEKHGVDWILSDDTGHMFIETKTKRMTLDARTLLDTAALSTDLAVIAEAVVQHYKNIWDALEGRTSWKKDDLPVYPIIMTLEDLYIFSPRVDEMLRDHVLRLLAAGGLSADLPTTMPYTIMSVTEFETVSQVIAQVGIGRFMAPKTAPNMQAWSVLPYADTGFRGELKHAGVLFQGEMDRLMPKSEDDLAPPTGANCA